MPKPNVDIGWIQDSPCKSRAPKTYDGVNLSSIFPRVANNCCWRPEALIWCSWWDGDHRSKFQDHVFALGRQDILYPKRLNPVIRSADMLTAPSHQLNIFTETVKVELNICPTFLFLWLPAQVLNRPDGLRVANFSEVPPGGRQVGVAEDHFWHDLDQRARERCIRCRMPAQVMRTHFDTSHFARLSDDRPGCWIGNRKDPFVRVNSYIPDIIIETVGQFLGNKYNFGLAAAFGFSKIQFTTLDITGG